MIANTMTQTLMIPNWWPARLNAFCGYHWSVGHKLKRADRDVIACEAHTQGITKATGKRRVSLVLVRGPRQGQCDPDATLKSLLDALTAAGLLTDDSETCVEIGSIRSELGPEQAAVITLEDLT